MAPDSGRSTTSVALLILGVLLVLWAVRFVVGLFVGLARLALVAGLVLAGTYAVYRLWRGWTDAGAETTLERPGRP